MDFDHFLGWTVGIFMALLLLLMLYALAMLPIILIAEAECLRAGYPKASVSIYLEKYCLNLDGTVTVKVEQLKK